MRVKGKNKIEISDIMVGDVWVCTGQSNMEVHCEKSIDYEKDVLNSRSNNIRLFKVKKKKSSGNIQSLKCKFAGQLTLLLHSLLVTSLFIISKNSCSVLIPFFFAPIPV